MTAQQREPKKKIKKPDDPRTDFMEHEFPGLEFSTKPIVPNERKGYILGDPNKKDELEEKYGIVINKKEKKKNKYGR